MAYKHIIVCAIMLFSIDLIYELLFQAYFLHNYDSEVQSYPTVLKFIRDRKIKDFEHQALHSIDHTIKHLITHLCLVQVAVCFLIVSISESIGGILSEAMKGVNFLFLSGFMSLTPAEMLVLQLEHIIMLYFECKCYFAHVFGDNILVMLLWFIVLMFFYVPLHARAKVWLEHRLHYVAPIAMAAMFSTTVYLYKYISFKIDLDLLHHLGSISDRFETLEAFCRAHNLAIRFFRSDEKHYDTACAALSLFADRNVIVYGDLARFTDREIEAALLHECFSFTTLGTAGAVFLPTLQKFLFAGFCIFFSKRFLKHLCTGYTGHITAFLVAEEALSMSLQRFLFCPLNLACQAIEARADSVVVAHGLGTDYAAFLLRSEVEAHNSHIGASFLYRLFNKESNLFERVDRLIRS